MLQHGETAETLGRRIVARAMRDEGFRQELIAKPRDVLNRELAQTPGGGELPEGIEVAVLEETPTRLYLVLPPRVSASVEGELSDADLAEASGGSSMCGIGPDGPTWNPSDCPF